MIKGNLYFQKIAVGRREYVLIQDIQGKEIIGKPQLKNGSLEVMRVEDEGNRTLVVLPRGMSKETAWISSELLN